MGNDGHECAQHNLLLNTLEKISTGVDQIQRRLANGDTKLELLDYRVQQLENALHEVKKKIEKEKEERNQQTVIVRRQWSGRLWDIAKVFISLAIGGAMTLIVMGIMHELGSKVIEKVKHEDKP